MTDIVAQMTLAGVPVNGLTDDPEITIRRLDTDAAVVTSATMSDQGGNGLYKFAFTAGVLGVAYSFAIDADPSVTGQVDIRTLGGAFNNEVRDIWNDRGLNPAGAKSITENVPGSDYDEAITDPGGPGIAKDVVKVGAVTTITRT